MVTCRTPIVVLRTESAILEPNAIVEEGQLASVVGIWTIKITKHFTEKFHH